MNRLAVMFCLCLLMLAGCQTAPTGDPPPFPQPSFEYSYSESSDATIIQIEVVDPGGLTDQPLRILVGEQVAYEKGKFQESYKESQRYENEWQDGVETGDVITIYNGDTLDPGTEVDVQLFPSNRSEYVTVSSSEVPR